MLPAGRPPGLLRELLRDLAQATAQRRPLPPLRTFSSTQGAPASLPQRTPSHPLLPPRVPSSSALRALPSPAHTTTRSIRIFTLTRLRDAIRAASTPDALAAAHLALAKHLLDVADTRPQYIRDAIAAYEEAFQLWAPPEATRSAEALRDDEAFRTYLRALASLAAHPDESNEAVAVLFEKIQTAPTRRAELLQTLPAAGAPAPAADAPAPAPTADAPASTPAAPAQSVTPSALITALFSGGAGRGKGGEAKVQSLGSFANWGSAGAGAAGKSASGGVEPIRVVVEEAKSPLVWRLLKFIAVTALYSFLLLSLLSLLIDSSGILRAGAQSQPFQPTAAPNPDDPNGRGTTFADVHGVEEAKHELFEIVEFLKDPKKFEKLGGRLPRGVLLTGPPGTGKTLLARAVAGEAGVPFFSASGSEFDEMYVGVGARRIRELFAAARKHSPAIVFIDELDAVGGKRSPKDQSFHKQTLNQLLTEMDGFASGEGIILIGATNFPESLDKALVRPGRFDRHVVVPLPDVRGRMEILKHHMRNVLFDKKVDLSIIARGTIGFSGADLQALVNQAAVKASAEDADAVRPSHFEWAKERIMMGAARTSAFITPENKLATAYHEAGHALLALYTKGAYPLQSITVIPRGNALGYTLMLPEQDRQSHSLAEYRAKLDVAMGGRVAEEIIYGPENVTDGASSDISSATNIAGSMVRRFGFSDAVGPVAHGGGDGDAPVSEETLRLIDGEVRTLVEGAQERARACLRAKKVELERLAKALVEYETLDCAEVEKVIKGEPIQRTGLE
ncbi:i-AAA protease yme1 [Rhodotorula kratochvilovae]